jgi:hypothetical protein
LNLVTRALLLGVVSLLLKSGNSASTMLSKVAIVPSGLLQSTAANLQGARWSLLLHYYKLNNIAFSTASNFDGAALHVKRNARQKQAMPTSA